MDQYELIKYNKDDIIIKAGDNASEYFYILSNGKTSSSYKFYEEYNHDNKKGSIMGLISSIIDEPYFSTIKVKEPSEIIRIRTNRLIKIENEVLIDKIYNYLYYILEFWLSKYYTILAINKVDLYNKDDIITMANIYKNNGFIDASYKLCLKFMELFPENSDIDKVKQFLNDIDYTEKLEHTDDCKFPKGYCLYSEIKPSDKIYIIKSGKVGIYSIVNSKQIVRNVYTDGYIVNGYNPTLEYQPLLTTAIVLEDSVIEIVDKEKLMEMMHKDKISRVHFIKMIAIKITNAICKLRAIREDKLNVKLIIIIYSMIKMYVLFNKKSNNLVLLYTLEDLKNMLNLNITDEEITKELKNIKYIELDNNLNIIVNDIESYLKKYKNYVL